MPRIGKGLTALTVKTLAKPGHYADRDGLYLQVTESGLKSWAFRFTSPLTKKRREMGLGPYPLFSLAQARELAQSARRLVLTGGDPIEERTRDRRAAQRAVSLAITFQEIAEAYIRDHQPGWKNKKHGQQWWNTLQAYAFPKMGKVPVADITVQHVVEVLRPIWTTKAETARRVRSRIENILDQAKAAGLREGENPAAMKGNLDHFLPSQKRTRSVVHHRALSYRTLPGFVADLRQQPGQAALALLFTILTCARTSETIEATWDELDLEGRVWTVPATRMKMGRPHRVPLVPQLIAIMKQDALQSGGRYVFAGQLKAKPLSNMAMLTLLRRMGRTDITVHGFRSSFRDWAAEQGRYTSDVIEAALAHANDNKVEAAYLRSDFFDQRRRLMKEWADFVLSKVRR